MQRTRLTLLSAVAMVLLLSTVSLGADSWGTFTSTGSAPASWLDIARVYDGGSGLWTWTYTLTVPCLTNPADYVHQFSVGLLVKDVATGQSFGDLGSGHYLNYKMNGASFGGVIESASNALWLFDPINDCTATFSFDTDLNFVGVANHQARDTNYTVNWEAKQTPAEFIPEMSTVMLGMMGFGAVGGLSRRFRRR